MAECTCFWTPPETWLSAASCGYGSGYEPGSTQEWNPECPEHPAKRHDRGCAAGVATTATCTCPTDADIDAALADANDRLHKGD